MPGLKLTLASQQPRATTGRGDPERSRRPSLLHRTRRTARRITWTSGEPSASDVLLIDLPSLSAVIAERFEDLPALYPDRDDYRYLVATGILVPAVTITAQLVADGSIVLFGIDIDLSAWPT